MESPAAMLGRTRRFYVAVCELEHRIAGLGGVEMNEIRLLLVSPEWQRRGVGRSLLEHLEAMVPAALFPDIFVYSSPAAESFYSAHGYMPKGKHVFRMGDQSLDTIFMVKKLK
jgi:predicted N-acetyltransferase YhbS